jgi:hypothetical protein
VRGREGGRERDVPEEGSDELVHVVLTGDQGVLFFFLFSKPHGQDPLWFLERCMNI